MDEEDLGVAEAFAVHEEACALFGWLAHWVRKLRRFGASAINAGGHVYWAADMHFKLIRAGVVAVLCIAVRVYGLRECGWAEL